MIRFTILVAIVLTVYAQEPDPGNRELVDIGGTQYLFTNDFGANWMGAEYFCGNRSMILAGFETMQEWDSVTAYMRDNGKMGNFWTNAEPIPGTSVWEWDHSGIFFDKQDSRWANSEPGGGPWDAERVVVFVDNPATLLSLPMMELQQVVCESVPAE